MKEKKYIVYGKCKRCGKPIEWHVSDDMFTKMTICPIIETPYTHRCIGTRNGETTIFDIESYKLNPLYRGK